MTTTTPPAAAATPISQEEKDAFFAKGFGRVENLADESDLRELGGIYDRLFAADPAERTNAKSLGGTDASGRELLPQVVAVEEAAPELLGTAYFARALACARVLFGPEARYNGGHAILKPAGYGTATPWHQDQAYHDPAKRYQNVNVWLPLDGATAEGGCMQYVAGTHTGPVLPHEHTDPGSKDSALSACGQEYRDANAEAVPCPRGAAALHHSYTMHDAGPNTSDLPRRALIFVFGTEPVDRETPWAFPWQAA